VRNGSAARLPSSLEMRPIRFEEVSPALALIRRAVERGCREHYDPTQRAAVFASYAHNLFVEALGPYDTIAAFDLERAHEHEHDRDGERERPALLGFAQLDPTDARLRALFVDGDFQQRGVGTALLAEIERRALQRGLTRLHGAMSLNAVPFYLRAGFRPRPGPERLVAAGVPVAVLRMEKDLHPVTRL
jgi:GNAT superfamily N-acetyltransferase